MRVVEVQIQIPRDLAQHRQVIAVDTSDMMDIRPENQLFFPALPVVDFKIGIGASRNRTARGFRLALSGKQILRAVQIVEPAERQVAFFDVELLLPLNEFRFGFLRLQ